MSKGELYKYVTKYFTYLRAHQHILSFDLLWSELLNYKNKKILLKTLINCSFGKIDVGFVRETALITPLFNPLKSISLA